MMCVRQHVKVRQGRHNATQADIRLPQFTVWRGNVRRVTDMDLGLKQLTKQATQHTP